MNLFGTKWDKPSIFQIAVSIVLGYLVGLLIKYINIVGTSENAPLICAMFCGTITFGRIIRKQKLKS